MSDLPSWYVGLQAASGAARDIRERKKQKADEEEERRRYDSASSRVDRRDDLERKTAEAAERRSAAQEERESKIFERAEKSADEQEVEHKQDREFVLRGRGRAVREQRESQLEQKSMRSTARLANIAELEALRGEANMPPAARDAIDRGLEGIRNSRTPEEAAMFAEQAKTMASRASNQALRARTLERLTQGMKDGVYPDLNPGDPNIKDAEGNQGAGYVVDEKITTALEALKSGVELSDQDLLGVLDVDQQLRRTAITDVATRNRRERRQKQAMQQIEIARSGGNAESADAMEHVLHLYMQSEGGVTDDNLLGQMFSASLSKAPISVRLSDGTEISDTTGWSRAAGRYSSAMDSGAYAELLDAAEHSTLQRLGKRADTMLPEDIDAMVKERVLSIALQRGWRFKDAAEREAFKSRASSESYGLDGGTSAADSPAAPVAERAPLDGPAALARVHRDDMSHLQSAASKTRTDVAGAAQELGQYADTLPPDRADALVKAWQAMMESTRNEQHGGALDGLKTSSLLDKLGGRAAASRGRAAAPAEPEETEDEIRSKATRLPSLSDLGYSGG